MYSVLPSFVLGFHGCDRQVGEDILAGKTKISPSENAYDWIGHGIYFWENNPQRALDFAEKVKLHPERGKNKIADPFVIGAVIDLGVCLNLAETKSIDILKEGYAILADSCKKAGYPLPENKGLLRNLDCAVINMIYSFYKTKKNIEFSSVRGLFLEGNEIYRNPYPNMR